MSAPQKPRPFHDLRLGFLEHREEILGAVQRALESGWYVLGKEVDAFEKEFAAYLGMKFAIGVANATDALSLALRAVDVKPGDHVAIPALTAIPTAMAVKAIHARPLLIDIDPVTFTMDPAKLRAALTKDTKAIVPVHLYGQCAAIDEIQAIAAERKIPVIEDAAQSQGAKFQDKHAGSFGSIGCSSFYPTKNLGAFGDGGALMTNDPAFAERLKRLRFYGQVVGYDVTEPGVNSRLDELQAAMLRVRLRYLDSDNARRRAHAARYAAEIRHPDITLPTERPGRFHIWHQFVIRCSKRDALRAHLLENGVDTLIHYPRALSSMTALAEDAKLSPRPLEAERAASEILSLPIQPEAPKDTIDATIAAINSFPRSSGPAVAR